MRPVGGQNPLAGGEVPEITNVHVVIESQSLGERVAELPGQPLRCALRDVRLKRVICRVANTVDEIYPSVLRADHDEVLGKACVEKQTAGLAIVWRRRQRLGGVDEIGEATDVTIRDETVSRRRLAQSLRCGQAVHAYRANS